MHQYQSGFLPDHSCHTALTRLCDGWLSAFNCSEIVGTVFLDLKKEAFDLVDYYVLLNKLSLYVKDCSSLTFWSVLFYKQDTMFFCTTSHLQRDW